jgi:hypothetical protein
MENENEPFLVDYYCPQKRQFNFKAYYEAEENFDRNRKEKRKVAKPKKRPSETEILTSKEILNSVIGILII